MIKRLTRRMYCPSVACRQKCLSISCLINIVFCMVIIFIGAHTGKPILFLLGFGMAGINIYDLFMSPNPINTSKE